MTIPVFGSSSAPLQTHATSCLTAAALSFGQFGGPGLAFDKWAGEYLLEEGDFVTKELLMDVNWLLESTSAHNKCEYFCAHLTGFVQQTLCLLGED